MAFQDVLKATFPPMILGTPGAGNASSRAAGSQVSAECWGSQDVEGPPPFWLHDFEADCWICGETRVHKALKAVGFEYLLVSQIQVDGNKICLASRSATRLCSCQGLAYGFQFPGEKGSEFPLVCCLSHVKIGIPWCCSFTCGENMGL